MGAIIITIEGVSFEMPMCSTESKLIDGLDVQVIEKFQEIFFSLFEKYGSFSGFIALLREYLAAQHQAIIYDEMGSYFKMKDIGRNIQSTYPKYSPLLGFFKVLPNTDSNGKVSKVQSMHFLIPETYNRYITFFIDPLLSQNLHLDELTAKMSGVKKDIPNTLDDIWDQSEKGKKYYDIIIKRLTKEKSPAINGTFLREEDGKLYWIDGVKSKPFVKYLAGFVWQMHFKGWIKHWQTGPTYRRVLQNTFNCSFKHDPFKTFESKEPDPEYQQPFANYPSNTRG